MARTTDEAVEGIIEVEENATLTPFIEAANVLVTEVCTSSTYDDARLELIERWLSAHFYAIYDPRFESEKAGDVAAKYQTKVNLGFDVTHYGQMAMRLDTAGGLASLNTEAKSGGRVTASLTHANDGETKTEDYVL